MCRRFMIAGTGSGCGKTTVVCAILSALVSSGKDIAAFKCGPDYIDPMFHNIAAGVESGNLDIFLMGGDGVRYSLERRSKNRDAIVIEGVMGLYDGLGAGSYSSSNHVSVLTDTPVVLVVGAKGTAVSVCALIKGFMDFEENRIRGVILNNISESSYAFYKEMIEERLGVRVFGFMPHTLEAQIGSRHLGLVQADEIPDIKERVRILGENAKRYIDIDAMLELSELSEKSGPYSYPPGFMLPEIFKNTKEQRKIKICIARDKAFQFCYKDNHELLEALGAQIEFFSPTEGHALPEEAAGLILWGGYPELFAKELEGNLSMKSSLKSAIESGLPVYAEGGGFMYLHETLSDSGGNDFEMLGALPGGVKMTDKLQDFGYYEIEAQAENILCAAREKTNAHFFQYSASDREGKSFVATKQNGKTFPCIVTEKNIIAGYQHIHFWGNPGFAQGFMDACRQYASRSDIP